MTRQGPPGPPTPAAPAAPEQLPTDRAVSTPVLVLAVEDPPPLTLNPHAVVVWTAALDDTPPPPAGPPQAAPLQGPPGLPTPVAPNALAQLRTDRAGPPPTLVAPNPAAIQYNQNFNVLFDMAAAAAAVAQVIAGGV